MTLPLVSVVVETITAREDPTTGSLANQLEGALAALGRQTYPHDSIETIVVLDPEVDPRTADELGGGYPSVKVGYSSERNYFAAKKTTSPFGATCSSRIPSRHGSAATAAAISSIISCVRMACASSTSRAQWWRTGSTSAGSAS